MDGLLWMRFVGRVFVLLIFLLFIVGWLVFWVVGFCFCCVVFGICLLGSGCVSVEGLRVGVGVYDGFWEGGF